MRWGALWLWPVVFFCIGCGSVAFKGDLAQPSPHAAEGAWPFAPASMRLHPFTSLMYEPQAESWVVEARIELLDQVGDVTKGVGRFRFELYVEAATASRQGQEQRIEFWQAPVETLEQNRRHYDPITRTYAFRLKLVRRPPAQRKLRLVAQFTDPDGRRLIAETPLRQPPEAPPAPAPPATDDSDAPDDGSR